MAEVKSQQSPVSIRTRETVEAHFSPDYLHVGYEDKYLPVTPAPENLSFSKPYPKLVFRGQAFDLRKIHIHNPAEHLLDADTPFAFECHLVHLREGDDAGTGPKVVIGVFFHEDVAAAVSERVGRLAAADKLRDEKQLPLRAWKKGEPGEDLAVNPYHFLPLSRYRFFHYEGSLTSGTFSEDVSWFVMQQQIPISPRDSKVLKKYAEQTAHPVQPLNRRFVLRSFSV